MKAFLSYSSASRGFASSLYEDIRLLGFDGWIDLLEIPATPTERTVNDLERALRIGLESCDCALLLVTDSAIASKWVQWETAYAADLARRRPGFRLVPLIYGPMTVHVPEEIKKSTPIDFSHGYNTALSRVLERLGVRQSYLDVDLRLGVASRRFESGKTLAIHVWEEIQPKDEWLAEFVIGLSNRFSLLDYRYGSYDLLLQVRKHALCWLRDSDVLLGNQWDDTGVSDHNDRLVLAAFPNPAFSGGEAAEGVLVTASIYLAGSDFRQYPDCTIATHISHVGSGRIWLAWNERLHRYTLGDSERPARLLMPSRKMGAARYAFVLWLKNAPSLLLTQLQGERNKHGGGTLEVPVQAVLARELKLRGVVAEAIERASGRAWTTPILRQEASINAHLCLGGAMPFEIHPASGISSMMARQLIHLLTSAGGIAIDEYGRSESPHGPAQWLSVSSLQRDLL